MTPIVKGTTAVFWGRVSGKDATYKELGNNRRVANFSLQYDSLPGEDGGRRKGVYINCSAWGEVADFAQNLERGDTVLCAGLSRQRRVPQPQRERRYLPAHLRFHFRNALTAHEEESALFQGASSPKSLNSGCKTRRCLPYRV